MSKYGIFADIAGTALALSAAATAITLGWTKRATWQPPEEAVLKGLARLTSLGSMIALAAIFVLGKSVIGPRWLLIDAATLFLVAVVALLVSIYLSVTRTFSYEGRRVLGGFRLTAEAARITKEKGQGEQQLFTDAQGDQDLVWTRGSRAAAQIVVVIAYLMLVLCGTIALTAAAAAAFAGALSGEGLAQ